MIIPAVTASFHSVALWVGLEQKAGDLGCWGLEKVVFYKGMQRDKGILRVPDGRLKAG